MAKILVIDDKKYNLTSISALLEILIPDSVVTTAQSGAEGIKKAQTELPDTILLDIRMPEMDGFEVCRTLKNNEKTKHIPVIMITATQKDSKKMVKGLELGADSFITKPINKSELAAQVKVALRIKKAEELLLQEKDLLEDAVKERTKELQESEAKYQDLYDNAPDMFISVDAKTAKIIECNNTLTKKLGYNKEEIIGLSIFDVYHPDFMEGAKKAFRSFVQTGEVHDAELELQRKDGSKMVVSLNATAVSDEQGQVLYSRSIWRDITARKQAEEALRKSEVWIRSMLDTVGAVILVLSPDHRIIEFNRTAEQVYGAKREDVLGENYLDLFILCWASSGQAFFRKYFTEK